MKIIKKNNLCECIYGHVVESIIYNQKQFIIIETVEIRGITLTNKHPDNIIQLKNGKIFEINNILNVQKKYVTRENINNLYIYGIVESERKKVFDYPTSSIDVGLIEIISWENRKMLLKLSYVKRECILLNMNDSQFAITSLHI